jgi:hypothetical protein
MGVKSCKIIVGKQSAVIITSVESYTFPAWWGVTDKYLID